MSDLPKSQELVNPLLDFLRAHGGVASNKEIASGVAATLGLPSHLLEQVHSGTRTEFEYRLAWARTKAKTAGLISSPNREHWQIKP